MNDGYITKAALADGRIAVNERERPSLMQTLQQTHRRVEGLNEALSILESKLEPLLLASVPQTGGAAGDRGVGVTAIDSLATVNALLEQLHQRANNLIQRALV